MNTSTAVAYYLTKWAVIALAWAIGITLATAFILAIAGYATGILI